MVMLHTPQAQEENRILNIRCLARDCDAMCMHIHVHVCVFKCKERSPSIHVQYMYVCLGEKEALLWNQFHVVNTIL